MRYTLSRTFCLRAKEICVCYILCNFRFSLLTANNLCLNCIVGSQKARKSANHRALRLNIDKQEKSANRLLSVLCVWGHDLISHIHQSRGVYLVVLYNEFPSNPMGASKFARTQNKPRTNKFVRKSKLQSIPNNKSAKFRIPLKN